MKIEQIREMDNDALVSEITSVEKEIMHLNMSNAIGTTENPVEIRFKRKDVARMKTILRERELANG